MKRLFACTLLLAAACALAPAETAKADRHTHAHRVARRHASMQPWHGAYYHTNYGRPLALVVPPNANMETRWGWGVSQGAMYPIYHQFGRDYQGGFEYAEGMFLPTPLHPSHTDQFGVYYVRGPW